MKRFVIVVNQIPYILAKENRKNYKTLTQERNLKKKNQNNYLLIKVLVLFVRIEIDLFFFRIFVFNSKTGSKLCFTWFFFRIWFVMLVFCFWICYVMLVLFFFLEFMFLRGHENNYPGFWFIFMLFWIFYFILLCGNFINFW